MPTIANLQQQIANFNAKAAALLLEMQVAADNQNFLKAESLKNKAATATNRAHHKKVILAGAKQAALANKIAEVNAIIAEFDIRPDQLYFNSEEMDAPINQKRVTTNNSAPNKTGPVAAKYRNPETGETWTGRGLKPRWLSVELLAGAVQSDFLIRK